MNGGDLCRDCRDCRDCREMIHARLDGDLTAERALELQTHLASCAACRDEEASLASLALKLRGLRPEPMPDEAFAAVLARTSRATPGRVVPFVRRRAGWIGLAAAAAAVAAVIVVALWLGGPGDRPTREELAQARRDIQVALSITAKTLHRAQTAGDRVLIDEVSPTLQRIPIRWRNVAEAGRRNRT